METRLERQSNSKPGREGRLGRQGAAGTDWPSSGDASKGKGVGGDRTDDEKDGEKGGARGKCGKAALEASLWAVAESAGEALQEHKVHAALESSSAL